MLQIQNAFNLTKFFGEDHFVSRLDNYDIVILRHILKSYGVEVPFEKEDIYDVASFGKDNQVFVDIRDRDEATVRKELLGFNKCITKNFGSTDAHKFTRLEAVININGHCKWFFKLYSLNGVIVPFAFHTDYGTELSHLI